MFYRGIQRPTSPQSGNFAKTQQKYVTTQQFQSAVTNFPQHNTVKLFCCEICHNS